jgi:4'-phosphopantetheinyl transferase
MRRREPLHESENEKMTIHIREKSSVFQAPGARGVHVWISRNPPPGAFGRFALSKEEEDRSSRFIRPLDRERYVGAHLFLKTVLAGYSGLHPEEIRLGAGPGGKPRLEEGRSVSFSDFNMAHSGSIILVGVAWGCRVGVDVEEIGDDCDIPAIAGRYLHPVEASIIETLGGDLGKRAFHDLWARKEAYSKALGEGLSLPPRSYYFNEDENGVTKIITASGNAVEPPAWRVIPLEPAPGYSGAAAFDDPGAGVRCFEFDPRQ